jgi:hypothetical protein
VFCGPCFANGKACISCRARRSQLPPSATLRVNARRERSRPRTGAAESGPARGNSPRFQRAVPDDRAIGEFGRGAGAARAVRTRCDNALETVQRRRRVRWRLRPRSNVVDHWVFLRSNQVIHLRIPVCGFAESLDWARSVPRDQGKPTAEHRAMRTVDRSRGKQPTHRRSQRALIQLPVDNTGTQGPFRSPFLHSSPTGIDSTGSAGGSGRE